MQHNTWNVMEELIQDVILRPTARLQTSRPRPLAPRDQDQDPRITVIHEPCEQSGQHWMWSERRELWKLEIRDRQCLQRHNNNARVYMWVLKIINLSNKTTNNIFGTMLPCFLYLHMHWISWIIDEYRHTHWQVFFPTFSVFSAFSYLFNY